MQFLLSSGIGYCTHTLRELEDLVLAEGYDGLEFNMPPRHLPPEQTARDAAVESVSSIRAIHAPGDVYDGPRFSGALRDAIALAEKVGATLVNIHPPALSQGGRENVRRGIELIKELSQETKVTIAYEMLVDPYGLELERQAYFQEQQAYTSLNDYIADVTKHALAATLDTAHVGTWQLAPINIIPRLGQQLRHVHLSDYSSKLKREHLLLGEGELDLKKFLRTLEATMPDITVTVELHPPETREAVARAIHDSMVYLQDAFKAAQ